MSDDADRAQEHHERDEEIRRKYKDYYKKEVAPTGFCLNCHEITDDNKRWCDFDCQSDWTKRQRK